MRHDQRDPCEADGSTSRSLLDDARQDDRAAWTRLVNLYAPLAAAWCRRWRIPEQDIADVLQELFAAVARNLGRFRKDQPNQTFRAWLATIARNKAHDYFRPRAQAPLAAGGTEATLRLAQSPDTRAADALGDVPGGDGHIHDRQMDEGRIDVDFGETLERALAAIRREFQERTWQAFWFVTVDGRTAADVAADLGMQPGAVRVAKSRVLSRLRRELGDLHS